MGQKAYQSSIVNRSKNKLIEYEHYLDKIEKEHAQNKRKEEELEIKYIKTQSHDSSRNRSFRRVIFTNGLL